MSEKMTIRVLFTAAIKETYLELLPRFERASGYRVETEWVPTVDLMTRLKAGEAADLVFMTSSAIEELIALGRIKPDSRIELLSSGIGVAVRTGAPRPDIGTAEAFKQAMLGARSICYSTGPSGVYLIGLFQRLGIADTIASKVKQVKGTPVGTFIASGEAEIGFQQLSELKPIAGIDVVGPLPAELQAITPFSTGIPVAASAVEGARALAQFLKSPVAIPVMKKWGLEPV